MKKQKILPFLILIMLFTFISIPLSQAQTHVLVGSHTFDNRDSFITLANSHPSSTAYISAATQTFQVTQNSYLSEIRVMVKRTASPVGVVNLTLVGFNTPDNLNSLPNATVLKYPDNLYYDAATIDTNWQTIIFGFDEAYYLSTTGEYMFQVTITGASLDASNNILLGRCGSSQVGGYYSNYANSQWNGPYDSDIVYEIYGVLTAPTPTPEPPTPTPSPTQRPGNYWDNYANDTGNTGITWMDNTIPYFIPLILIMVCAFLGWYFAKTWGFMAGLNLGVIFAYVIFPLIFPVWGVLAVIIVDGLLIYSKVERDNSE